MQSNNDARLAVHWRPRLRLGARSRMRRESTAAGREVPLGPEALATTRLFTAKTALTKATFITLFTMKAALTKTTFITLFAMKAALSAETPIPLTPVAAAAEGAVHARVPALRARTALAKSSKR